MKREDTFDIARGIGMLAVIVAHMAVSKFLYNSLYTFHLPLFFIISGYFFHYDERFSYFLLKKVKGYLIPYVFFALIITLFDTAGGIAKWKWYRTFLLDTEKFIVQLRYSTLWFLAVLFLGVLIFWIIHWLCKSDLKKVMIVGIGIGIIFILYDTYI
jgi:fucose 4-O-acetylase-like acetyltransferase